ncbi:hypothetical protein [Moraxella caviae]|nr:hypothetical protein [Moraxella caviae]
MTSCQCVLLASALQLKIKNTLPKCAIHFKRQPVLRKPVAMPAIATISA